MKKKFQTTVTSRNLDEVIELIHYGVEKHLQGDDYLDEAIQKLTSHGWPPVEAEQFCSLLFDRLVEEGRVYSEGVKVEEKVNEFKRELGWEAEA